MKYLGVSILILNPCTRQGEGRGGGGEGREGGGREDIFTQIT